MTTVSIVTPSFNQGPYIEKTILSVLKQTYPAVEYIVVDGGSTDGTLDILQQYRERISTVIVEKDDGQSDALNKGFALAAGDVLAYLNSDDCYANAGVVARVVNHFHRHSDVDVIYGPRTYINQRGQWLDRFPYRAFSEADLYGCDFIPQECTFWTRRIYEQAGGFIRKDLDFAMDYELWLRFVKQGARFLAVDEPIGLFRSYAAQKSLAQWQSSGLTEIRQLQQEYLGRCLTETEMADRLRQHLYGPAGLSRTMRELFRFGSTKIGAIQRKVFRTTPLDEWVYRQPLAA